MPANQNSHIRHLNPEDVPLLRSLFFNSVHSIAAKDYTKEQLDAWAPLQSNLAQWAEKIMLLNPFVIETNNIIVGYADLQANGLIDHFFIAAGSERKGFGSQLMNHIIETAHSRNIDYLYAYVSLTAQPFFIHFGFQIEERQQVEVRGVLLSNARMAKYLNK